MTLLDEPILPRDCSFLVAVPTNLQDFYAALRNHEKDFVRSHFVSSTLSDDAKWRTYKSTADDIEGLMSFLGRNSVTVIARATLADWVAQQHMSRVVIL